jgi:Flp pilus assembly protein TadD
MAQGFALGAAQGPLPGFHSRGSARKKMFDTGLSTFSRRMAAIGLMLALATGLSACKTTRSASGADPMTTGSVTSAGPSLKATARAAKVWKADMSNIRAGLAYARQLEALEQTGSQLAVLKKLVSYHPKDMGLRAYYGRALLKGGRHVQAEGVFRAMITAGQRDWKTYNALGSALAEQGRYSEARAQYNQALRVSPGNVKVINNIAMSHILEGNPAQAETMLRRVLASPAGRGQTRIRQNLALAVGLQGRFKEARYIASQDLPPAEVEANMAYLKRMLGGSDTWKKLQKS